MLTGINQTFVQNILGFVLSILLHGVLAIATRPKTSIEPPRHSVQWITLLPTSTTKSQIHGRKASTKNQPHLLQTNSVSATQVTKYLSDFHAFLQSNFKIPEQLASQTIRGKLTVEISLDTNGVFSQIRIAQSSGNAELDAVAVQTIQAMGRFQKRPDLNSTPLVVRVPFEIGINSI